MCLRIKNSRGMTVKSSWIRSMRCAGPLTGHSEHTTGHGALLVMMCLFAPLLCKKKTSGTNILHQQLLQSLYMETGKTLKLQRNKLFLYARGEMSPNAVSVSPVWQTVPQYGYRICTPWFLHWNPQHNWAVRRDVHVVHVWKQPWWLWVDTLLIFQNCWYSINWAKNDCFQDCSSINQSRIRSLKVRKICH